MRSVPWARSPLSAGRRQVAGGDVPVVHQAEALVLDTDDPPAIEGEVPAQDEAERVASGRPIEGGGHRSPPVDDQWLLVGPVDGQATDVEGLDVRCRGCRRRRRRPTRPVGSIGSIACAVAAPVRAVVWPVRAAVVRPVPVSPLVDPPEGQRLVADVQLLESGQARTDDDVPLGTGLESAPPSEVEHALHHRLRVRPHGVETFVGRVDESLLSRDLGLHPTSDPATDIVSGRPWENFLF